MKNKKFTVVISAVIIVCIIAIGGYTFSFKKTETKKQKIAEYKFESNKKVKINLRDVKDKMKTGKIKTLKGEESVCSIYDDNHYISNDSKSLYFKDKQKNEVLKIAEGNEMGSALFQDRYKDNVIYVLRQNETYNNKDYEILKICIYNINTKKTEVVRQSEIDKENKNGINYKFQINGCIRVYNNNILYAADSNLKGSTNKIYGYNMDTKKESLIYSEKNKEYQISTFDADINSGYIICSIFDDNSNNYIQLINLKNHSTKILAKAQNTHDVVIKYPYAVFNLNDQIHVYNIKKNDDDGTTDCGDNNIRYMKILNDKLFIKVNNIYSYSFKEKKVCKLDYPDDFNEKYLGIDVMDGRLCWFDGSVINYMDVDK